MPKKVFHALFHLISVNFSLLTLGLLALAFQLEPGLDLRPLALPAGVSYLLYALVEIIIALGSGIPGALGKMFLWIFFLVTGGLALAGFLLN